VEKTAKKLDPRAPADPKVRAARAVIAAAGRRNTTLDPDRLERARLELKHAKLRRLRQQMDDLLDGDEP
jgi:hypothetical protein